MQHRSKLINRLALVLISIVLLELILIGDQVQSVKAIKKKILVKKLKKILPLLALVKPKKKVILVPIPIPIFNKHSQANQFNRPHQQLVPMSMNMESSSSALPPSSFTMTVLNSNNNEPKEVSSGAGPMQGSGSMMMEMIEMPSQPSMMMMPSMTMTIQSPDSSGSTTTAIELSNSMMSNATSGALLAPSSLRPSKAHHNQHHYQQQQMPLEQFTEQLSGADWGSASRTPGGEYYYSSPWVTKRPPLASPAKVLRGERIRQPTSLFRPRDHHNQMVSTNNQAPRPFVQQQAAQTPVMPPPPPQRIIGPPARLQPIIVIKNQWKPSTNLQGGKQPSERLTDQPQQQQRQLEQMDLNDFVPVGPPQLMPIYQTPNGQFHMTPPPIVMSQMGNGPSGSPSSSVVHSSFEHEDSPSSATNNQADNSEVQTIGEQRGAHEQIGPAPPSHSRQQLASGSSTANESQQEQQAHELDTTSRPAPLMQQPQSQQVALKGSKLQASKKRPSASSGGGY